MFLLRKKNVGTCYFWNECFMHPIEVSYPLRGQVLANVWSPNTERYFPHVMFFPGNVISSYTYWFLLNYTESKLSSEEAGVLHLPKT